MYWPSPLKHSGILSLYWGWQIDHELRKLLKLASAHMSICQDMSDAYKERYQIDCIPSTILLTLKGGMKLTKSTVGPKSTDFISYAGRIGVFPYSCCQ